MKYLSVCSGIEAATVAWHSLGWKPVAFSEIEPFPSKVLAHHYPDVPNLGDMTKFNEWKLNDSIELLVGGTPCQSFSVAGLRQGLKDPRGNLMLTYLAIADKFKPEWIVWENVPGVLSSNNGRDFAAFLEGLAELGYGWAYRVLDAQNCRTHDYPAAVPQRRRRVFVVGCLGGTERAAKVLFEPESLLGNSAPSRKTGKEIAKCLTRGIGTRLDSETETFAIAPTLNASFGSKLGLDNQHIDSGAGMFVYNQNPDYKNPSVAKTLITKTRLDAGTETLITTIGGGFDSHTLAYSFDSLSSNSMKSDNPGSGCRDVDVCKTLDTSRGLDPSCNQGGIAVIALAGNTIGRKPENGGNGNGYSETGESYTLTKTDVHAVCYPINSQIAMRCDALGEGTGFGIADNGEPSYTLQASHHHAVAYLPFDTTQITSPANGNNPKYGDPCHPLASGAHAPAVAFGIGEQPEVGHCLRSGASKADKHESSTYVAMSNPTMSVRRITPTECERLQGFPDGYTNIPGASDSPRYKALGNSMAVNVMQLIGERIQKVVAA
jgi:DNA (cytosine-5)-methyltransferase 1